MTALPALTRIQRLEATRVYLVASPVAGDDAARLADRLAGAVDGGARLVQLRLKHGTTAMRRRWLAACRERLGDDVLLIVNDDVDAVWSEDGARLADGVHLGRQDAAALSGDAHERQGEATSPDLRRTARGLIAARRRLGPELLLGTSTRTEAEVRSAVAAGVDHVGFGAIAASPTKSDTTLADLAELSRCIAAFPRLPIFAIGGLGPDTLPTVVAAGCRRAAVGSAILEATDPAGAVAECLDALRARM